MTDEDPAFKDLQQPDARPMKPYGPQTICALALEPGNFERVDGTNPLDLKLFPDAYRIFLEASYLSFKSWYY